MKKIFLLFALTFGVLFTQAQSVNADYNGLLKAATTLTNAATDSTLVTIPGSRSAITFKYSVSKTSGTVAGTIVLQYKLTNLASEPWHTYNTYTLTDATAVNVVTLTNNPALRWKILTTTTGTQVSVHRQFLLYRK
jgi:hypothetical protein